MNEPNQLESLNDFLNRKSLLANHIGFYYSQSDQNGTIRIALFSFPGLFCYVYIEPQPKKPRRPHTTGPKPHQLKTPTPKTQ